MTLPTPNHREEVDRLFDLFVARNRTMADPDPAEFARQAGERGPELLRMIAAYLDSAPPAWPPRAAIERLAAGYARRRQMSPSPAPFTTPRAALSTMLAEWTGAAAQRAAELAARAQREAIGLTVVTATRGALAEREGSSTLLLDHPQGGRAEVGPDRAVTIVLGSLPAPFVGLRPLVAFPRFRAAPTGFEWRSAKHGLPEGIVQLSEPIGAGAELRVTIGRLGVEREGLGDLLGEIRVISEPDAGQDLIWEGG